MKFKLLILTIFAITFSSNIFAQKSSVLITSDKVIYDRKRTDNFKHKNKVYVNYPKISGINDAKLKASLELSLDYWKTFDLKKNEELYDSTWLSSLDYKVNYNTKSILSITLVMEGVGAYPSTVKKNLVINTKTGKIENIPNVFKDFGKLLVKIDKLQKVEIKKAAQENEISEEYYNNSQINRINTLEEFIISDKGVIFIFDYGFPHVAKALEPEGRYFFTFAELKPFIRRDGLLGQFVR